MTSLVQIKFEESIKKGLNASLNHFLPFVEKLKEMAIKDKEELDSLIASHDELKKKFNEIKKRNTQLETENNYLNKKVTKIEEDRIFHIDKITKNESDIFELKKKLNERDNSLSLLKSNENKQLQELRNMNAKLLEEINHLKNELSVSKVEEGDEYLEYEEKTTILEKTNSNLNKQNSTLENENKTLISENQKYKDLLAKAEEENKENVVLIKLLKENMDWMKVHTDGINSIVYNSLDNITLSLTK